MEIRHGLNWELQQSHKKDTDWKFGVASSPCILEIPLELREKYFNSEQQNIGDEKFWCATAGPQEVLEAKFEYGYANSLLTKENERWLEDNGYVDEKGDIKFSKAFNAILSGTNEFGNSMIAPMDSIRNDGLIPNKLLPQLNGFKENYDPKRITQVLKDLGQEFKQRFTVNREEVQPSFAPMVLLQDILTVALYAWPSPINGIYPTSDNPPCHVSVIYKPKYKDWDTYRDFDGDFIKDLAPDYKFYDLYRIYVSSQATDTVVGKKNWLQDLIKSFFDAVHIFFWPKS